MEPGSVPNALTEFPRHPARLDQSMIKTNSSAILSFAFALSLTACFGSSGGGGSDGPTVPGNPVSSESALPTSSSATTGALGQSGDVDIVDISQFSNPDVTDAEELDALLSTAGLSAHGIASYDSGLGIPTIARSRIIGANNLYDLFQTNSGPPLLSGGPPFDGGDANGDGSLDGGPGLFSAAKVFPTRTALPNTMGSIGPGASPEDQHQFIQIRFPFDLDMASLFNPLAPANSFLGDSITGLPTVEVFNNRVERSPTTDTTTSILNIPQVHVTGVAVIAGITSIPLAGGGFATIHPSSIDPTGTNDSFVPEGARALIGEKNVFTYIAHEQPTIISIVPGLLGFIDGSDNLILPDPTDLAGRGGRVLGANTAIPGAVNDFATAGASNSANVGFISLKISSLRTTAGKTIADAYFHSYEMSQANVGLDPLAVDKKDRSVATSTVLTFSRGPAIPVDTITSEPAIDVLSASSVLGSVINPADLSVLGPVIGVPASDAVNVISTRSKFRVDFDKEVIPNSVGFSRQYTIHSVPGKGIIFPFNGNTRPVNSPAGQFILNAIGSPLAPSIFLAVNQPTALGIFPVGFPLSVNQPLIKDVNQDLLDDNGAPIGIPANGLYPPSFNTLATLPRGVVPCDIYPVNQNNLQAYIIEPLVDLPPGSVVTLGVCRQGLGMSNNLISPTYLNDPNALNQMPASNQASNHGNFTKSGTTFTPWQGTTAVGLGDSAVSGKQAIIGNHTIIKVNAGPMDLDGNLFFGGTGQAIDTLINNYDKDNLNDGGWNVCRSFQIGLDLKEAYVNVPVAPQALIVGFANGLGVLDLCGTGINTNAVGGAESNMDNEDYLIVSKYLSPITTGKASSFNWDNAGSASFGSHSRALGIISRYSSGGCLCTPTSLESEFAIGAPIPVGSLTPSPGVNEGSSGYESMAKNSFGSELLTNPADLLQPRDIMFGDFLDTVYFDQENPFATVSQHRTYNTPTQTGVTSNNISDPPIPNPPPLRFPIGLNYTAVIFNQNDLTEAPFLIESGEVFASDTFIKFDDGTPLPPALTPMNSLIQLNPETNASNPSVFDRPHLPNPGYPSPFAGENQKVINYVQTGPMPKTTTAGAIVLATLNAAAINSAHPGGLVSPLYQTRQQIGNFLFVTDGVSKKLHAINSNTMKVIQSLSLPDPYGMGLSSDLDLLFVSNEGNNTVSVVVADPRESTFMTEISRVNVGQGPRAVCVSPDNEDVFVLNRLGNTVSIIDVNTQTLRHTLTQSGINRPNDICMGLREVGLVAFQSGTFHGFISNGGGDNILIYEGGPSGQAGIGFDNILGEVKPNQPLTIGEPLFLGMDDPRGMAYDPAAPLDAFGGTIGCYVAHQDPLTGRALVSRLAYTADDNPGVFTFITTGPSFGAKVFKITQQYVSNGTGTAYDVALPDFRRETLEQSNFGTNFNLYNAGATLVIIAGLQLPRNAKYPQAGVSTGGLTQTLSRWFPDKLYLASGGNRIDVFDIDSSLLRKTITTSQPVTLLTAYFEQ
jgi:hypothetical protein